LNKPKYIANECNAIIERPTATEVLNASVAVGITYTEAQSLIEALWPRRINHIVYTETKN